jgi:hypothetical protein
LTTECETEAELETLAAKLAASGADRVLRKLTPRPSCEPPMGVAPRQGLFVDTKTAGLDPARDEIIVPPPTQQADAVSLATNLHRRLARGARRRFSKLRPYPSPPQHHQSVVKPPLEWSLDAGWTVVAETEFWASTRRPARRHKSLKQS